VDARRPAGSRDYQLIEAEGLALAGLAICREQPELVQSSCAAFRKARDITTARGAVRRCDLLLDLFPAVSDRDAMARIRAAAG